jgi:hypothetical protein
MIRKGKPGNCAGNGKAEMEFFNFKQFSKKWNKNYWLFIYLFNTHKACLYTTKSMAYV